MTNHWNLYAQSWSGQSTPLRPSFDDLKNYSQHISSIKLQKNNSKISILGVTPEIFHLGQSMGFAVKCIDQSQKMIDSVWPGPRDQATLGNWSDINNFLDSPTNIICDGGFHLLEWNEQIEFLKKFKNSNLTGSNLIFRLFLPPKVKLSCNEIFEALERKQITNINYLKVNLWHAIELNQNNSVQLNLIWDAIAKRGGNDIRAYLSELGFTKESIDTIEIYKANNSYYYFRNWNDIQNLFYSTAKLKTSITSIPSYIQGDQFPVVTFSSS